MSSSNRFLAIVTFIIKSEEPKRLTEISKALNISTSTVYRILRSLKSAEWVVQDQVTKKYKVGIHLLELALSLISRLDLKNISLPFLELLNKEVNESVMLSTCVDLERIYVEQVRSHHELQHIVELGKRMPLWVGAPGKAMLAYLEETEIEQVIDRLKESGIRFFASGQGIDIDKLREELAETRNRGFSTSSGERIAGTNAVAAPIFNRDHRVVGAISIGGPAPRFSLEVATGYGPLIKEMADKITLQLVGKYAT